MASWWSVSSCTQTQGTSQGYFQNFKVPWPAYVWECLHSTFPAVCSIASSCWLCLSHLFGSQHLDIDSLFEILLVPSVHQAPPIISSYLISDTCLGDKRPDPPKDFISNFAPESCDIYIHLHITLSYRQVLQSSVYWILWLQHTDPQVKLLRYTPVDNVCLRKAQYGC